MEKTLDNRRKAIVALTAMPFILLCTTACAVVPLSAAPIDSQVVDAQTSAPIEGAIVVAYWQLDTGSLAGDSLPCGAANVEEAVTDKDGKFHIPGWGPTLPGCGGTMSDGEPMLYIFKHGYYHGQFSNGIGSTHIIVRTTNGWQGRQIKLKIFSDLNLTQYGPGSYFWDFNHLEGSLKSFTMDMPAQCNWTKMPNMMRAIALQENEINEAGHSYGGVISTLIDNDGWLQRQAPRCGSTKLFFAGLMK
jgi:hypothetical protein